MSLTHAKRAAVAGAAVAVTAIAGTVTLAAPAGAVPVPLPEQCSATAYPSFTAGDPTLRVNGNAAVAAGGRLRVTPSALSQAGSAFTTNKVNLADAGSFSSAFQFQFTAQRSGGADGLVFAVQPVANNVGGAGGGIGYAGITPSIGVEFDNWFNGGDPDFGGGPVSDPNDSHVGIDVNGKVHSVATSTAIDPLDNGQVKNAWVDYNGATDLLEVRLSQSTTRPVSALVTHTVDLPTLLGTTEVFAGFTSGTGAAAANHDVLSWTLNNCYYPIGADNPPVVDAGGPYGGAEGSAIALDGADVTDDSGSATTTWTYTPGPAVDPGATCAFSDANAAQPTITCTDDGTYGLEVTATDGVNPAVTANATVEVTNNDPAVGTLAAAFTGPCTVAVTAPFTDSGSNDTHTATVDFGDGAGPAGATVSESAGSGSITATHEYTSAGTFPLTATVADDDGGGDSSAAPATTKNSPGAFLPPINAGGTRSSFKIGSTIPVKVGVTDCDGTPVSTLAPRVQLDKVDAVPDGPVNEPQISEAPTNGKEMRWVGGDQFYLYNLSTKNSQFSADGGELTPGTYRITVTDGSFHQGSSVYVNLR